MTATEIGHIGPGTMRVLAGAPSEDGDAATFSVTLETATADERDLIRHLLAAGVSGAEIAEAWREDRLVTAAFQHLIRPPATLNLVELADVAGVPAYTAARAMRTLGLPPVSPAARAYAEPDIEMVRIFAAAVELLGEPLAESVLRVVGTAFDRIADAAVGRYYAVAQPDIDASDVALVEQAESIAATAALFCDGIGQIAPRLLAAHLWQTSNRYWRARQDVSGYQSAHLAVGFVDLVGFTPLSRQLSMADLDELVSEFESVAFDAVAAAGGRVVKLIGDEVMFVAADAGAAVDGALTLIDAFRNERSRITPRGAIAVGELLTRDGDYYGPTVNLAARMVGVATGYDLLVTNPAKDALVKAGSGHDFDEVGDVMLKGFDEPVALFRVARGPAVEP